MHALIDADRLAYCFGSLTTEDGYPQPWGIIQARVDDNLNNMLKAVGAKTATLYLTSDDKSNFRFRVATIKPYKGNRKSEKYFWYEQIRRYLIDIWEAQVVTKVEADDALGIAQYSELYGRVYYEPVNTVICSVDKDLDNIPGWHYNELTKKLYEVSEVDALRNFYCQCLTGDPVDNVCGLYGVGRASSLLKQLHTLEHERDMYLLVKTQYEKRFGSYWRMFLYENGTLLWILRSNNPNELKERFENLERQSSESSELEVA